MLPVFTSGRWGRTSGRLRLIVAGPVAQPAGRGCHGPVLRHARGCCVILSLRPSLYPSLLRAIVLTAALDNLHVTEPSES